MYTYELEFTKKKIHHKFEWSLILSTPTKKQNGVFESGSFQKNSPPTFKKKQLVGKVVHVQLQTGVICKPNTFLWAWRLHMESWLRKRAVNENKMREKTYLIRIWSHNHYKD